MPTSHLSVQSSSRPAPSHAISWAIVAELAALVLLWPLSGLTGLLGTGAPRALAIVGITTVVWIAVVGVGQVPRPILILTLTGVVYGLVTAVWHFVPGLGGFGGSDAPWWTVLPALMSDALWGALTGLAALGVQRLRGVKR